MDSPLAFVLLDAFIFKRLRAITFPQSKNLSTNQDLLYQWGFAQAEMFIHQGSYLKPRVLLSRTFTISKYFSFMKEVFHKQRFFLSWRSFLPQAKIFPSSRKFSTSQDFSFIKEAFHKPIIFLHQGSFSQGKIFPQRSIPQANIFPQVKVFP